MNQAAEQISNQPKQRIKTVALAGNPNVGKSTLFNALTGSKQKIANYPGVTVEKKMGTLITAHGYVFQVLDLPGCYSLNPQSQDEEIATQALCGQRDDEESPDIVIVVAEALKLDRGLMLFQQIKSVHPNVILALNMMDELKKKNLFVDTEQLSKMINAPVVELTATSPQSVKNLTQAIEDIGPKTAAVKPISFKKDSPNSYEKIDVIVQTVVKKENEIKTNFSDKLDTVLLNPFLGPIFFLGFMYVLFQSLFSWAGPMMDVIDGGITTLSTFSNELIQIPWLQSLVTDGIIAGVGSVVIFVPQIAITFLFIGIMEMSGYMARGGFLIDRLMRAVGLEGRAFVPLLSSFACAIPGVLATRTLPNAKQRLITILIAPLMTCSARLPVYTLLIAAFIPSEQMWLGLPLQGLTLFGLFLLGILAGMALSFVFDKLLPNQHKSHFIIELPKYRIPTFKNIYYYVSYRTMAFLKTAGTVIFLFSLILWASAYFPRSPEISSAYEVQKQSLAALPISAEIKAEKFIEIENNEAGDLLANSYMGRLGKTLEPAFAPMGFDWKLGIATISSFAAREVFVSTLGIVFHLGETDEESSDLRTQLQTNKKPNGEPAYTWRTALSLLIFFALACQCTSTLAVIRRETNSWKWPAFVFVYMTILAYGLATITYQGLGYLGFA